MHRRGYGSGAEGVESVIWSCMAEVLLYVHRNRRDIRDGSPGRPPRLSHTQLLSSCGLGCTAGGTELEQKMLTSSVGLVFEEVGEEEMPPVLSSSVSHVFEEVGEKEMPTVLSSTVGLVFEEMGEEENVDCVEFICWSCIRGSG